MLLYDRNANWIPKLETMSKKHDTCMAVVGAGYLCGEKSVVELLQAKGWTVTQQGRAATK